MSRGGSFGGGQSSLGYLFESNDSPNSPPKSTKTTEPPPADDNGKTKGPTQTTPPPLEEPSISNSYQRAQGQNAGNFITGRRSSTRVRSVPGGCSSLGYLFGDK